MEYIEIIENIAKTMEKAGCPLNEAQRAVLAGCLAIYLTKQTQTRR